MDMGSKPILQLIAALEDGTWRRGQAVKELETRRRINEGTSAGLMRAARIMREARWQTPPAKPCQFFTGPRQTGGKCVLSERHKDPCTAKGNRGT